MTRTTNELLKAAVMTSTDHLLADANCAAVKLEGPGHGQLILAGDVADLVGLLRQHIAEHGDPVMREAISAFCTLGVERFWMRPNAAGGAGPWMPNKPAANYPDADRFVQFECKRVDAPDAPAVQPGEDAFDNVGTRVREGNCRRCKRTEDRTNRHRSTQKVSRRQSLIALINASLLQKLIATLKCTFYPCQDILQGFYVCIVYIRNLKQLELVVHRLQRSLLKVANRTQPQVLRDSDIRRHLISKEKQRLQILARPDRTPF